MAQQRDEQQRNEDINQLYRDLGVRLGPYKFGTNIPMWNPALPINEKLEIIQRLIAVLEATPDERCEAIDQALKEKFKRLSPQSWTAISDDLSVDEKSKLIQKGLARLEAQKKAQAEEDRKARAARVQQLEQMRRSQAALAAADVAEQERKQKEQLDLEKTELLAKAAEVESYLDSIDVHELDGLIVRRKAELKNEISDFRYLVERAESSHVDQLFNQIDAISVHCNELYGIAERARERMRLDQEEARHARDVKEFQERKARLMRDDQKLNEEFGELNRLPKTSDYAINDKLKQLAKELSKHHTVVAGLMFSDRARIESLEKKSAEFRERFEAVNKEIAATHRLLADLKDEAEEILSELTQYEGKLLIIENLNEPIVALQERAKIFLQLLNQKESKNMQILNENLVPFLRNLRESSREVFRTLQEQDEAILGRGRQYFASRPKFYMTKGGWVVEKLGDKNRVIGQIVPAAPPHNDQYIIRPITAANREAAQNIERYPLTKIVHGELSNEEIIHRRLSRENNTQVFSHRHDVLPPLPAPPVYGYYGFYKDSDVVGFAIANKDVPEAERGKLTYYPVGKHKIVGDKVQIQFDPKFDPHAWNITTRRLPEPSLFIAQDRRRYGHEDYSTDYPMYPADRGKLPRFTHYICEGGIVVKNSKIWSHDGVKETSQPIAKWSLSADGKKIQVSAINDTDKQHYENLIKQGFEPNAVKLKQYNPKIGVIDFTDSEVAIGAVDLAPHQNLSGKYYIYDGGYLIFEIGGSLYPVGMCELEGNKIKFNYTQLPTINVGDILGKHHVELKNTNTAYADYSRVKGGVPNAVLDLLPEAEKKKEFDKRMLKESRHYSPEPQPDVVLGAVGRSVLPVLDSVSTDKTPGDLYLYNGGIVVEEKTIERNIAKKVVGRWEMDGDHLKMKTVTPEEGEQLQSLLDLSGPRAKKMKVVNSPVVDLSGAPETKYTLNEIKNSNVGYYRFRGDGSVWFCPAERFNEPSPGFFAPNNKKRKREWEYTFDMVGTWKLNDKDQPEITYTRNPDHKIYTKEDVGYVHLLTEDKLPRPLGHQFTKKDFKDGELAEAADQLKKYSVDLDLDKREKALSSDNKAWHLSLKRSKCAVFEDTYGASHLGRHTIMTPEDQYGSSKTFWHDTKSNTIGIPPGAEIDDHMIRKYVELAGHFCKPKLDANAEPAKMAIRFSARVRQDTRDAIVAAIVKAYPKMENNIDIARDEAHFKQLLSKDNSESQSQPASPRLSAR